MVRELQPHIILNDRLDLPDAWDVKTPEQYQPHEWVKVDGKPVVWEACQTFSGSWGYYRDEYSWREPDELIRTLIDTVSKGGNLLLNVGPNARGEFDPRAIERLRAIGEWMRLHGRSIYGCTASEFTPPPDCRFTQNGKRLYLHLFAWPYKHVHLDGLAGKVAVRPVAERRVRGQDAGDRSEPAGTEYHDAGPGWRAHSRVPAAKAVCGRARGGVVPEVVSPRGFHVMLNLIQHPQTIGC